MGLLALSRAASPVRWKGTSTFQASSARLLSATPKSECVTRIKINYVLRVQDLGFLCFNMAKYVDRGTPPERYPFLFAWDSDVKAIVFIDGIQIDIDHAPTVKNHSAEIAECLILFLFATVLPAHGLCLKSKI